MRLVFYSIYLLFFLLPLATLASVDKINESIEEIKGKIKEVEATPFVKDIKKAAELIKERSLTNKPKPIDTDLAVQVEVCVECTDIISLTESVNKILQKLSIDNYNSYLDLEIGNLEAVTTITKFVDKSTNQVQCFYEPNVKLHESFTDFNEQELIPIFSESDDFIFRSAQFKSSTSNKIVWLRGKDQDANKVIKVETTDKGETFISYYRIDENRPRPVKTYVEDKNQLPDIGSTEFEAKTFSLDKIAKGNLNWTENFNVYANENTKVRAKLGTGVEYEYFLPNRITLVDFEASVKSGETTLLTDLEITTDTQQATVSIERNDFKAVAKSNLASEYEVGGGVIIDILSDLQLDTYTTYSSNKKIAIDSKFIYDNEELFTSKYEKLASGEQRYSLSKEKKYNNSITMSIKIERTKPVDNGPKQDAIWLNFSKKF